MWYVENIFSVRQSAQQGTSPYWHTRDSLPSIWPKLCLRHSAHIGFDYKCLYPHQSSRFNALQSRSSRRSSSSRANLQEGSLECKQHESDFGVQVLRTLGTVGWASFVFVVEFCVLIIGDLAGSSRVIKET